VVEFLQQLTMDDVVRGFFWGLKWYLVIVAGGFILAAVIAFLGARRVR
jgi:hypothetical protein